MKLVAVAAASMLLVLGSAHAQAQPVSPLYGELGYTFLKIDDGGVKLSALKSSWPYMPLMIRCQSDVVTIA